MRAGLEAQSARLRARLAAGEERAGWKIALNDPRVQQALGIAAPVIGYMTSATVVRAGEPHSLAGATRPAIEPEIAIHVGDEGAIAALGTALEVIDVDMPFEDLGAILERNVFHRAAALGPPVPGESGLAGRTARLTVDGAEQAIDVEQAGLDPAGTVQLVSGYLAAIGDALRPGDVIIAGSLVTALPLRGDAQVALDVDGLRSVALELRAA